MGKDSTSKCGLGARALAAHDWRIRLGPGVLALMRSEPVESRPWSGKGAEVGAVKEMEPDDQPARNFGA